jgi:coenzyme Q-binding protein COQ10
MRVHRLTRTVPYTPDQMFALVADIERYPEFVPWVSSMRTWNSVEAKDGVNFVDAEAGVGFSFLKERFATRVRRDPTDRVVNVDLLSGPFKRLVNEWRFAPHNDGCEIQFFIEFAFKNRILDALLEANFDRAVNRLIGCFEARARVLYG